MVAIVLRVVSVSVLMVIDWVNVNFMGVMVLNWVGIVMHFVVSWFCYMRYRVIIMMACSNVWLNVVLNIILMLRSMSGFVVLSWLSVGVDWFCVGVFMNIYDWVVILIMGVMRISSWVNVGCLVIVMDNFMVEWLNVMAGVAFKIMTDSLMWCTNIIFSHMVVMMVTDVSSMVVMIVVNVL